MKIVVTGGHHNSALELAQKLQKSEGAEITWFGHRHTTLNDSSDSAEYSEVTKAGIPFVDIKAGKLYKTFHPIHWLRIPYGFFQAYISLWRTKPDLIVSFGGYLAVPVVIAGFLLGIPSVTHEQTAVVGMANKLIAKFAKKIFITWPSSAEFFDKNKVIVTGLPLRESIFNIDEAKFVFEDSLPTLYVTAGKQGSHLINTNLQKILPNLLNEMNIIHQCGSTTEFEDFQSLQEFKSTLSPEQQQRYVLRKYVFQDEIGSAYNKSDIVLCRAGAHTIYELAALRKPALIIPISWVSHNEQLRNAQILESIGAATILEEKELTPESLYQALLHLLKQRDVFSEHAKESETLIKHHATQNMIDEIMKLV